MLITSISELEPSSELSICCGNASSISCLLNKDASIDEIDDSSSQRSTSFPAISSIVRLAITGAAHKGPMPIGRLLLLLLSLLLLKRSTTSPHLALIFAFDRIGLLLINARHANGTKLSIDL